MDLNSRQTIDVEVTEACGAGTGDCTIGTECIDLSPRNIDTLMADGAYCGKEVHKKCYKKGNITVLWKAFNKTPYGTMD